MTADPGPAEPLTRCQAALFFAEAKAGGAGYNIPMRVDVRGPVTDEQLVAACRKVHRATPALRIRAGIDGWTGAIVSRFASGEPVVARHRCDVAGTPLAADLLHLASDEPFEVDDGPLVRYLVIRTDARCASVALIAHHLVLDGLSYINLARRLTQAVTGPVTPEEPQTYLRLVRHVRDAEDHARHADRAFWLSQLPDDLLCTPQLPANPETDDRAGGKTSTVLDAASVAALKATAAAHNVRLFHILSAAVHHALPATATPTTVVCATTSLRTADSFGDVTGCFVNQIPLVARTRYGATVNDIVASEGAQWTAALRRRNFPFLDLANHVHRRNPTPLTLDSVMISYRKTPRSIEWSNGEVTCSTNLYYGYTQAKTELEVRFFDHADQIGCEVHWGRHLPSAAGKQFSDELAAALGARKKHEDWSQM
jgi:hypothetical protein